ncbi:uncharacterized protein M6B38_164100 [Iris pallida]|uniref:Uncharacterized protein n=1 Tax=Iris pallida TaxID=29817 RepID=A0AAX6EYM3_IRIPA|nr:uncharacterized protein M6B38_164100 [Iris pallida]
MASPRREGFEEDDRRDPHVGDDLSEASVGPDVDLLMDRIDVERRIGNWIRALDRHVAGACRADERLKPLLKLDISSGVAEERFMAQLSQHFEAAEVGLLARCLCVPLVSIRVGIVNKHGNLLCPTSTRGHLNLTLLPSSNIRVSFTGDDGLTKSLAVLSNDFESSQAVIEELSADDSGRSFLLKLPGPNILYFWCSEKSKMHGMRLLAKMKDLLRRKPSLSHLTGICRSRLDSFAVHLRAYLLGLSNASEVGSSASSSDSLMTASSMMHASEGDAYSQSVGSNSPSFQLNEFHTAKAQSLDQTGLGPRHDTVRNGVASGTCMEGRIKQQEDNSHSSLLFDGDLATSLLTLSSQSTNQCGDVKVMGNDGRSSSPFISQPEMPSPSSDQYSSIPLLLNLPPLQIGASKSLFSPYYCWCPPCPSSLQYSLAPHETISFDESLPLPPLSSLLSVSATGALESTIASNLPGDGPNNPTLKFPSLLPEAYIHHPLPVSSLITMPSSKQIPTFTPYMSDPIVHIPVIDVCSSGQGYLVNTGSSMPSSIPPMLPSFVSHPLIPNTESPVEKGARETLRMLMASTPSSTSPNLINVLPAVFNRIDQIFPCASVGKHGIAADGSRDISGVILAESVKMDVLSSRVKVNDGDGDKIGLERENRSDAEDLLPGVSDSEGYDHTMDTFSN